MKFESHIHTPRKKTYHNDHLNRSPFGTGIILLCVIRDIWTLIVVYSWYFCCEWQDSIEANLHLRNKKTIIHLKRTYNLSAFQRTRNSIIYSISKYKKNPIPFSLPFTHNNRWSSISLESKSIPIKFLINILLIKLLALSLYLFLLDRFLNRPNHTRIMITFWQWHNSCLVPYE